MSNALVSDPAVYPAGRPSNFAMNFIRLVHRPSTQLDLNLKCLLTVVALAEERNRFRQAPQIPSSAMADKMGLDFGTFLDVGWEGVRSGWLVWIPAERNRPAIAWVTIPTELNESIGQLGEVFVS